MNKKKSLLHLKDVFLILGMVKGFSGMIIASTIIRALEKLCGVFLAVALAIFVEGVFTKPTGGFALQAIIISSAIITKLFVSYLDTYISHDVSFKIVNALQGKMYAHMDAIAPGGLSKINSADSATIILSDISVFEWFVAHCLVEWLGTLITVFICLVLLSRVSYIAAVVVFLLLAFMMSVPFFTAQQAGEKGLRMKRIFGELNGIVADGVLGHKDILAFHWTTAFFQRLDHSSEEFSQTQSHYAGRSEGERTLEAIVACAAVLAGTLIASGNLAHMPSHIIPVFVLCTAIANCIQDSLSESTNFGFVFGAAERMMSVFNIQAPVQDAGTKTEKDVKSETGDWHLSLENISYHYLNASDILKGLSFSIRSPEVTAIVAASGEGKSTIAKLLQRFWDVDSGGIYINATDIRDISLESLRNIIMVVEQDTFLFRDSIRNNLRLASPDASDDDVENALRDAQAISFVSKLPSGIDTVIGEDGLNLSGGECQRIALAQAFLKDPPILVLDEVTSALDPENEKRILENIRKRRAGKITLIIAHRISSMQNADRIVFIKDGKVFETGTYTELMEQCADFKDLVRGEYSEEEKE